MSHVRLGPLHLLAVPGRLCAGAGMRLRARAGARFGGPVVVTGPVNGNVGRIAGEVAWREGHPFDLYGPGFARWIETAFLLEAVSHVVQPGPEDRKAAADRLEGLRLAVRRRIPLPIRWALPSPERIVLHLRATAMRPLARFHTRKAREDLRGLAAGAGLPYDGLFLLARLGRLPLASHPTPESEPLAPPGPRSAFRIQRVWLDSTRPSGHPQNDRFPVEHYVPPGRARGAVIVLPIWKGGILLAERIVAAHLAKEGFEAAILPLPWQFQRAERGVRSGDWTVSGDLQRTEEALRQALADVTAVADWLVSRESVTEGKLAIVGISLGAHVAAVAYRHDARFRAGVFVMAGGDPASLVWSASRETRRMKQTLVERGVTLAELRQRLLPLDPAAPAGPSPHPRFSRYRGILMVNGTKDTVIPPANARLLNEALGRPELLWLPEDHYSMAFRIGEILKALDRHTGKTMKGLNEVSAPRRR